MSEEPKESKSSSWLAFLIIIAAIFGLALLARVLSSLRTDAPKNSDYATAPRATESEAIRIQFGANKAVTIAVEEVKKREGWSANPNWASVTLDEGPSWLVTVRGKPRSSEGERRVFVNAMTGKVDYYVDPSTLPVMFRQNQD
jgi:hypothetical protein